MDEWEICGQKGKIEGNKFTAHGSRVTAYGKKIISKGTCVWKVRYNYSGSQCCRSIGIATTTNCLNDYMHNKPNSTNYVWYNSCICARGKSIANVSNIDKNNDIITIKLDLDKHKVSFWKNDDDQNKTVITDVEPNKKYRLSVHLDTNGQSFTIISCNHSHDGMEQKNKGKIYSKYGIIDNGNYSPQIILNLTHLNKLEKIYKVNFNLKWHVFIKNNVEKYLLDLAENFDYFINGINENKKILSNYNGLLSSAAKLGDTIIIRSKPNAPLPAKPVNVDDGEFIPCLKPLNFDDDDEKKEVNIIKVVKHKKEINKKIINSLLNVDNTNKKLSKLINIESFNKEEIDDDKKCDDDNNNNNNNNNKLNLDYKLHLDLDYDLELKNKNEFLNNMKKEISESLNVDINSIHINSVDRGSVILLISIDEKGTTEIYKDAILTSAQFDKWSINRCLKGKNINNYYKNKNKNFDGNTKMWQFLKHKFGETTYNSMKQQSINKYNEMKNKYSSLIEPLSFDQIAAIYLYTTNYLYKPLNRELRDGKSEFADFTVELICGINKLPLIWTTTYRGLGPNFTKYHSYIPKVYKKGSVIRWDGMNSTSKNKNVALKFSDQWVIQIEGYHGRDIQPFSAYSTEDEVIYIISSHFIVTNVYNENGKIFFKVREMPFPWNNKAILWVDDKPTNNKDLIFKLEKKGIMVIPRISTHDALQFMGYMKNIFLDNNKFNQFRVISDMTRYEKKNENNQKSEIIKNRNAGAILVNELRKNGYNQKICIYTGNKQRAIDECKKFGHIDNIKATTSTNECFQFADY